MPLSRISEPPQPKKHYIRLHSNCADEYSVSTADATGEQGGNSHMQTRCLRVDHVEQRQRRLVWNDCVASLLD